MYIEESTWASQPTIGTNSNGLIGGRLETVLLRYFKRNHRVQ